MLTNRPAVLIAITAGLMASSVAFMSDAGAEDRRADVAPIRVATAVFAGGDYRFVEADFDKIDGVIETVAGYTGGSVDRPSHRQVLEGGTGHYEAVKVTYDPSQVSYEYLAEQFVRTIDPTNEGGQFCNTGDIYRGAIFVSGESERNAAVATLSDAQRQLGKTVVTEIRPLTTFWPAEAQYQDYHLKYAAKLASQQEACGRGERLMEVWGLDTPAL